MNNVAMVKGNLDTELGNSLQNNIKLQVTTLNLSRRLGPTYRDEKMRCPIKAYRIYIPPLKALLRNRFHALVLLLQGALLKLL